MRVQLQEPNFLLNEFPSLPSRTVEPVAGSSHTRVTDTMRPLAQRSRDLQKGPPVSYAVLVDLLKDGSVEVIKTPRSKPAVGASVADTLIKSVQTRRMVDVFISRLHPCTTAAELQNCIECIKGDMPVLDVKSNNPESKYGDLYASIMLQLLLMLVYLRVQLINS